MALVSVWADPSGFRMNLQLSPLQARVRKSPLFDGRVSRLSRFLPIDDASRVAEARRLAQTVARAEGMDQAGIASAELIASEMATNLWKHAKGGELLIERHSAHGSSGIDIISVDKGPGIVSIQQCLQDGYSGSGTSGTGLGAIKRVARVFDAYSEVGKGTVMLARITEHPDQNMTVGAAGRPVAGEDLSGDSCAMRADGDNSLFIVADGLGHGIQAAEASAEAISAFRTTTDTGPALVLHRVHRALRGTRGAAVAIASLDRKKRIVRYAGIGNIAGVVVGSSKSQSMISHNGTAGHEAAHFQEFSYQFPESSLLIMHSDGLSSTWNLKSYPGLQGRHPSVIGGVLYRDAGRVRDDACIVVARECA
jgi:anti-sigma regulatory factor (Ser/Thr protein kinase)